MSDAIELQSRPTATDAPEYSSGPSTLNDDRPYVTDLPTAQELGPPEDPIEANDQHPLVSGPYVNTAVDHHEMDHVASEMSQLHMEDGGVKEEAWSKWMTKINERWIFEQVSAILSVSCMVALIGVLLQAKNNAPSRWMWQSLTLNGLIALISTVMRASIMLSVGAGLGQTKWNFFAPRSGMQVSGRKIGDLNTFDQASRGPMGSFKLLFNRPGLHLGTLGALITILALAFDTFAQQVIVLRFKDESNIRGSYVGAIPRSEQFTRYTVGSILSDYLPDLTTEAAVNNGIYNWQETSPPKSSCSTGNCTWPIIPSLAVCGSCNNVTTSMESTCSSIIVMLNGNNSATNCTYTLLDGDGFVLWRVAHAATGEFFQGDGDLAFAIVDSYASENYNESNYIYLDRWLMIDARSATATTCGLWFCVQTYNISVDNGNQTQDVVGIWNETDYQFDKRYEYPDLPETFNFTNIPDDIGAINGYSVGFTAVQMFERYAMLGTSNAYFSYDLHDWFFTYATSNTIRSVMEISDYNLWIERFALGLSNNVRSIGSASQNASLYAGKVLTSVPYVHVRWAWLSFPAIMIVAALVFLVACMWQTQRLHVGAYKNDALTLLLAKLDTEGETQEVERIEIEEQAAWLDDSDTFLRFRRLSVAGQ